MNPAVSTAIDDFRRALQREIPQLLESVSNTDSKRQVAAEHVGDYFDSFMRPLVDEFMEKQGGRPVLLMKHFTAVLITTAVQHGLSQYDFLSLSMAHNPELPRDGSLFSEEYAGKLAEFRAGLVNELRLKDDPRALLLWRHDRFVANYSGENEPPVASLVKFGPKFALMMARISEAQAATVITEEIEAVRAQLKAQTGP